MYNDQLTVNFQYLKGPTCKKLMFPNLIFFTLYFLMSQKKGNESVIEREHNYHVDDLVTRILNGTKVVENENDNYSHDR